MSSDEPFTIELSARADAESQKFSLEQLQGFLRTVQNTYLKLYEDTDGFDDKPKDHRNHKFHAKLKVGVDLFFTLTTRENWNDRWIDTHRWTANKPLTLPNCLKLLDIVNVE